MGPVFDDVTSVEVRTSDLVLLTRALRAEADGKELRRDLIRGLRVAVTPAVQLARASILSMGVHGVKRAEPPLRTAVAAATKIEIRTSGKRPGVRVVVRKSRMPRGFRNAPKRLQQAQGWEHPVFGDWSKKVVQRGKPGWFDDTLQKAKPAAVAAAKIALDRVAQRISARTRG